MSVVLDEFKQTQRAMWAAGDYAALSEEIAGVGELLVERAEVAAGMRVLDVACGTGNAALPAARRGGEVTGLDLVPGLLQAGQAKAASAGLEVEWVEGDAEALPFDDESFDAVLSVFGVQFAPRHAVVADELTRVTRPGGRIGLVNWTPDGLIGQLFKVMGRYMPAPPDYASPPPLWGDEEHVRELFADAPVELEFTRGHNPWRFDSAEHWVVFMETHYGPMVKAREKLTAEGRWEACREEIHALAERHNEATDGTLLIQAEYLVTIGRKQAR